MRVVVTGGAGFIGAHSCRAVLEAGHAVTALDDLSHGKREALPPGADLVVMDVRSPQLADEFQRLRPDAVLHLAAQMDVRRSVADPLFDARVNVLGTIGLLEAARRAGVRRVVYAASSSAYGNSERLPKRESDPTNPLSPYAAANALTVPSTFTEASCIGSATERRTSICAARCSTASGRRR